MKTHFSFFLILLLIAGCTNPIRSHITTLELAFRLNQDAEINLQEVQESSVELALIRSGERPLAVIAKAFSEEGKDKWISEDKALLVVEAGRVIRTQGFKNDLLALNGIGADPLADPDSLDGANWRAIVDWEAGEYGYLSESSFSISEDDILIFDKSFATLKVTEVIQYKATKNWLFGEQSWENVYWFEKNSKKLLKSRQKAAPHSNQFVITYVSQAASLVSQGE